MRTCKLAGTPADLTTKEKNLGCLAFYKGRIVLSSSYLRKK